MDDLNLMASRGFEIFNIMELLGMEKSMTSSLELVLHI